MLRPSRLVRLVLPAVAVVLASCSDDPTSPGPSDDGLVYVSPEDVGWSSSQLDEAREFAEQAGFSAVMAVYDGQVFLSWGDTDRNFLCHSIRKPFLSALYGIHVARNEIDLDATLSDLGIDDIPPSLTAAEKQATVRELLQGRSGVYHEAAAEDSAMVAQRPERGSHPHGTFYYYNNWDFNAAGTVFRTETGLDIFDAFETEIAGAIGMQDFDPDSCGYQYEPQKSAHPAYHFRMSARDMARFGVLYQKGGVWRGRRILPETWIAESTASYSIVDAASGLGYGYMWRVITAGSPLAGGLGAHGYFHTGAGVHALVVLPELKLVIVERVDTDGESWPDPGEAGMALGMMIVNARRASEE